MIEEGSKCPDCGIGVLEYPMVENCACHINPPCNACVENLLTCPECGWEKEMP